eukprot:CAMPEP_0119475784 /NCGR_PEP_ID=MMETSP1344-20130328/6544_1 /TAXON_ID=236787 /ORGANISM="Florenciella parvula, Strain CCMP2471" /LENGTH=274 /DNA_ID=CAMNT_0007509389 /DNA_START=140 /DNA_END=960 /DNA_ORIENTATION=-
MFNQQQQHQGLEPSFFGGGGGASGNGGSPDDEFFNPFEQQLTQEPPHKELIPAPEDYTGGSSFPLSQILPPSSPTRQNNHQAHFDDTAINGEWRGEPGRDPIPGRQFQGQGQGQGQGRGGFPDENRAEVGFAFGSPGMNSATDMSKSPTPSEAFGSVGSRPGGALSPRGALMGGAMAQAQRTSQMIEKAKQMRINPGGGGHDQHNQHSQHTQHNQQMPPGGMVSLGDIEPPSPDRHSRNSNGNGNSNGTLQHGTGPPGLNSFFGGGGGSNGGGG